MPKDLIPPITRFSSGAFDEFLEAAEVLIAFRTIESFDGC